MLFAHSFVAAHSKYIHTSSCLRLALHKNHSKLKINVAFCTILRCCVLDVWHTPSHLRLVLHKNHSKLKIFVAFCVILRCCVLEVYSYVVELAPCSTQKPHKIKNKCCFLRDSTLLRTDWNLYHTVGTALAAVRISYQIWLVLPPYLWAPQEGNAGIFYNLMKSSVKRFAFDCSLWDVAEFKGISYKINNLFLYQVKNGQ